ncbi:endolytic transglycosylase MltG [Halorhodospira halochloris]|uniref:endolytic transglycosylase MltG n=1 Tax=Halorhodospira halochloris TaxID=1052 RepID=UPI001EE7B608|nr:endolytic transglycosylase MltG [Halorhodospira halochloris]MCG5549029.1 endolytic transglycosylase MltG [Halorhodospira halochloris]
MTLRGFLFILATLAIILPASILGLGAYKLNKPLQVDSSPKVIEIADGSSLSAVAHRLEREGWVDAYTVLFMRLYGRITGLAGQIKTGEYAISDSISAKQLLDSMAAGDVVQHRLTVVEGWTLAQLLESLRQHDRIEYTLEGVEKEDLLKELGIGEDRHPEGLFYPTTYNFPSGITDRQFLRNAYSEMIKRLEQIWQTRQVGLPLDTPYDALILASIIEREARVEEERARIAGVFIRRLDKGMRLQADPTVVYGIGDDFSGRITRADLRRDTPYNTYTRSGLPPTPIALPGSSSIKAAVNPEPGDELYFVARGDGTHHFSSTLEEHNRAVQRYILGNR